MKVNIENLGVEMQAKNTGVEFWLRDNDDKLRGKLYVNKRGLTWCRGKTKRENGEPVSWSEFIGWVEGD